MGNQITYFIENFNRNTMTQEITEVPNGIKFKLGEIELDGLIRQTFEKFGLTTPLCVIVQECGNSVSYKIFRANMTTPKEVAQYNDKLFWLQKELDNLAEVNSDFYNGIHYRFYLQ